MSILLNEKTEVLIQGITGRQASMNARYMLGYGTKVVAGVSPGKGGTKAVDSVPVYNTVREAIDNHPGIKTSAVYAPARAAKGAAFEAIEAGIKFLILIPERMPQQDMLEVIQFARDNGCIVVGPNSIGLISPGKAVLGLIGARVDLAREIFKPGPVGVMSRSGGNTTTACYYLTRAGIGQSTAVGVGGDAFIGATWADLLPLFEKDPETKLVVAYGEIGTTVEEDAAELIRAGKFTKPLIVYVGGKSAFEGVRFGHAGAMITKGKGTAESKTRALREVGAICVDHFFEVGDAARDILAQGRL